MPIEDILTYDLPVPRRAAFDDIFYTPKTDLLGFEVKDPNSVSSREMNQLVRLMAAAHRTMPVAVVSVRFAAGVPTIFAVTAAPTAVTKDTFTITDVGDGDTKIEWPANTFPPPIAEHSSALNDTAGRTIGTTTLTNGATIITRESDTKAQVDAAFTLSIY